MFVACRCCAYQENMEEMFRTFSTEIPTPTLEDFKIKRQTLLTNIGGEKYLDTMRNPKSTMKKPMLINKQQEE